MPVHELGYRSWNGDRGGSAFRWWVIAVAGVRLAWQARWLRRMLFFAWLPTLFFGALFFIYEQAASGDRSAQSALQEVLTGLAGGPQEHRVLVQQIQRDAVGARHDVWSNLLLTFFRSPQAFLMILLVGQIAPSLIARDVRTKAFLIYFARPLAPFQYALGKASVVWAYLLMITCLPALALYVLALLLSPDLGVLRETWDLPLRIVLASIVLLVPTTMVALAFSSLTSNSRYAAFAWFAMWILGWVSFLVLTTRNAFQPGRAPSVDFAARKQWSLVSPYETLGQLQSYVFGLQPGFSDVAAEAYLVIAVTLVATFVLLRRVTAPIRT